MLRRIATKQRRRIFSDIAIGAALALGLALAVVSIDSQASASTEPVSAPADCELPYADQVAKQAAGELPHDLNCS